MKIMNYLTIKNLKLNKKRTIATIIGIILTSVLLFTLGLMASTFKQNSINDSILFSGDYHVAFDDLSYEKLEILNQNTNIQNIKITQVVDNIYYENLGINEKVNLRIIALSFPYENYLNIVNGKFPKNDQEILISFDFASQGNYNIGDKINNYTISGIYDKSKLNREYTLINDKNTYTPYAYTTQDNIKENYLTSFYLTYKSPRHGYQKIYETADSLGLNYEFKHNIKIYENTTINISLLSSYGEYQDPTNSTRIYLFFCLLMSVLCLFSYFAIYNSFEISLSERKKQIGTLRSIGASKKQIFKSIMFEILILLLISLPISFILSATLVEAVIILLNHLLKNALNIPLNFSLDVPFMLISLIFIILTVFISSIMPAKRASNTSIMDIIRKKDDYHITKSKENYFLIKKIFGIEGEVAYKNIKRNSSKFTLAIISLALSFILFITTSTFINYILVNNEYNSSNFDISIILMNNSSEENQTIINKIAKFKQVDKLVQTKKAYLYFKDNEFITNDFRKYNENNEAYSISLIGLDEKSFKEYQTMLKTTNNILLYNQSISYNNTTEYSYETFNKQNINLDICEINNLNDLSINTCYLSLNDIFVTDVNYYEYFNTPTIIIDINYFDELVNNYLKYYSNNYSGDMTYQEYLSNIYFLNINSKHYKKFDTEMKSLINENPTINIQYTNYILENYEYYQIYLIIKLALYSIILFIVIIGISSVFNTINTSMELRTMEFSSLRSIGLSKKGLNKMIYLESFFLGLKSLIYGLPISLIIIYALTKISKLTNFKTAKPVPFPTTYLLIGVLGLLVIIFIIMRYSLRKIKKQNIIDAIREESI